MPAVTLHIYVAVSPECDTLSLQQKSLLKPVGCGTPLGVDHTMTRDLGFHSDSSQNLTYLTRMCRLPGQRGYITISGDHPFRNGRHYLFYCLNHYHNLLNSDKVILFRS